MPNMFCLCSPLVLGNKVLGRKQSQIQDRHAHMMVKHWVLLLQTSILMPLSTKEQRTVVGSSGIVGFAI